MDWKQMFSSRGTRGVELPLDALRANPAQPRRFFDEQSLRGLASSIEAHGLLNPVAVRRLAEGYELIAGERRTMACRLLGRETIPAIVIDADDDRSAELALIENLQRSDLDFLEEALALRALLETQGCPQKELALRLGISQPALANKLRVLRLPRGALERLAQAGCTERHARALLPLADDARLEETVGRVIASKLTVSATEALVARLQAKAPRRGTRTLIVRDLRLFTGAISRAVDVMKEAGIDARAVKTEDSAAITYTIVIPKSQTRRPLSG